MLRLPLAISFFLSVLSFLLIGSFSLVPIIAFPFLLSIIFSLRLTQSVFLIISVDYRRTVSGYWFPLSFFWVTALPYLSIFCLFRKSSFLASGLRDSDISGSPLTFSSLTSLISTFLWNVRFVMYSFLWWQTILRACSLSTTVMPRVLQRAPFLSDWNTRKDWMRRSFVCQFRDADFFCLLYRIPKLSPVACSIIEDSAVG